ncbi:serine hydrolase domain-containing protein [Macrococcus animalis]|uniref:serine hydrolase domain-containing protein n=1 Tax=Macrococcus animalis TaxID=3395467 RepID=UPI0039BDF4CD
MKKLIFVLLTVALICCVVIVRQFISQMEVSNIKEMSYEQAIRYTLQDSKDGMIAVGTIERGKTDINIFSQGEQDNNDINTPFEIGSISKTMLGTFIADMAIKNKLDIERGIFENEKQPNYIDLLTHTSGADAYYFEMPMIKNTILSNNPFNGINKEDILQKYDEIEWKNHQPFSYSNYGYALLGVAIERNNNLDYTQFMDQYLKSDLKMEDSRVFNNSEKNDSFWQWNDDDSYKAAGAIISTPKDMMNYLKIQIAEKDSAIKLSHQPLRNVEYNEQALIEKGIMVNQIGYGWMIDNQHHYIWHNGATGNQNAYIAFSKEEQKGIFILSNLPLKYKASATWIGTKWMQEQ